MDPHSAAAATAAAPRAPLGATNRAPVARRLAFTALPPLALYVHLPWCIRKCPYCDFNSYEAGHGGFDDASYVDALLRDLDAEPPLAQGRALSSVFIGGGTPSLFTGGAIARLLAGVAERLGLAESAEVTLEANPGAVDAARFAEYRDAGVNRLSIGVQSFRAAQLRRLGRVHGPDEAVRAIDLARAAGFERFNVDLMYALPDDDVEGALSDLHTRSSAGRRTFRGISSRSSRTPRSIASRLRYRPRTSCSRSSAAAASCSRRAAIGVTRCRPTSERVPAPTT